MKRRAVILGIAACLVPTGADARRRYRVYYRRRKAKPVREPELSAVKTIRVVPLPTKLAPTWADHWAERIGSVLGLKE